MLVDRHLPVTLLLPAVQGKSNPPQPHHRSPTRRHRGRKPFGSALGQFLGTPGGMAKNQPERNTCPRRCVCRGSSRPASFRTQKPGRRGLAVRSRQAGRANPPDPVESTPSPLQPVSGTKQRATAGRPCPLAPVAPSQHPAGHGGLLAATVTHCLLVAGCLLRGAVFRSRPGGISAGAGGDDRGRCWPAGWVLGEGEDVAPANIGRGEMGFMRTGRWSWTLPVSGRRLA